MQLSPPEIHTRRLYFRNTSSLTHCNLSDMPNRNRTKIYIRRSILANTHSTNPCHLAKAETSTSSKTIIIDYCFLSITTLAHKRMDRSTHSSPTTFNYNHTRTTTTRSWIRVVDDLYNHRPWIRLSPTTGKQEGQLAQLHSHSVTAYWLHCLVPPKPKPYLRDCTSYREVPHHSPFGYGTLVLHIYRVWRFYFSSVLTQVCRVWRCSSSFSFL